MVHPKGSLGNVTKNRQWLDYAELTDGFFPILRGKYWMRFIAIYFLSAADYK